MPDTPDLTTGFAFDNTYKELPSGLFADATPTPVKAPVIVQFNHALAIELGLDPQAFTTPQGAEILGGNTLPPGAASLAQAYAGHQFGHFTMLGDGRAILLGEHIVPNGERFDIQLKGAGPTAYSRSGDGRAALGPMLREYLISEAMHALGVPSTRSLAVVATGDMIRRDRYLPGAVLTRIAKGHLRVGTFQYASAALPLKDLKALADYAIARHYPQCQESKIPYLALLESVIDAQACLIAKWQSLGFVHGVMNTDNMSISGETIDYGPCAFIDIYTPNAVFSSIDQGGRYAYSRQPGIAGWNLARLGEALLPLLEDPAGGEEAKEVTLGLVNEALKRFHPTFEAHYNRLLCLKIGIAEKQQGDAALVSELLGLMHANELDFTYTFYALTRYRSHPDDRHLVSLASWIDKWQKRLALQKNEKRNKSLTLYPYDLMKSANPAIIPYNHRVEDALNAAAIKGNYEPFKRLLFLLQDPYAYSPEQCAEAAPASNSPAGEPYRTFCGT